MPSDKTKFNIALKIKQLKCKHDRELTRWHIVYYPTKHDKLIEVEYVCMKCGQFSYLYLRGTKMREWISVMSNFKKVASSHNKFNSKR